MTALIALLVLGIGSGQGPALAQKVDIGTRERRFNELYSAGNYPAALIQVQKLEAAVKARFGRNNENYAAALNDLAMLYRSQQAR